VVGDGEVRSVTHRDVQRGPDNWECEGWRPSGREPEVLRAVMLTRWRGGFNVVSILDRYTHPVPGTVDNLPIP
jgi:hypothetical protein